MRSAACLQQSIAIHRLKQCLDECLNLLQARAALVKERDALARQANDAVRLAKSLADERDRCAYPVLEVK